MDRRAFFTGLTASVAVAALPIWALARKPPEPIKYVSRRIYTIKYTPKTDADGNPDFDLDIVWSPVVSAA